MPVLEFQPIFASALQFAFEKSTPEGKITICALLFVSLFSWTVIFAKIRQLITASRKTREFFRAYGKAKTPMEIGKNEKKFIGAPAYAVYLVAVERTESHLKNASVAADGQRRMSSTAFDTVRVSIERATSDQVLVLERGMIVLSTAVAGGPFLGLLGTVWGVMETFAGIARASAASLTAMAPGVAGALIATVVGLFVAIPAMFSYNFMVTKIRAITQQLDAYAAELVSELELHYVDATPWLTYGMQQTPQLPVTATPPQIRAAETSSSGPNQSSTGTLAGLVTAKPVLPTA